MSVVDEVVVRMRAIGAGQVGAEVGGVEKEVGTLGRTAKAAAGIAGLGALAFGLKDIVQGAMAFQAQTNQINNALHQTGQYSQGAMDRITNFADTLSTHGGYDPAQTLEGVQKLIRAHDSVAQAIRDETLATDIARSGQTSYTTALRTVSIIEQGRVTNLARLGIVVTAANAAEEKLRSTHQHQVDILAELTAQGVKFTAAQRQQYSETHRLTPEMLAQAKAQDAQATKLAVLNLLWHRFGGSTKAFSDSSAGAVSNFSHSVGILGQRLGSLLLPAITAVADVLTTVVGAAGDVATFFEKDHAAALTLAIMLGLLATAYIVLNAATIGAAIATGALSLALFVLSNVPIVLLIAAIAFAIYELIKHFGDVKTAAVDAFHWIVQAGKDARDWIIGAWHSAVGWLVGAWGTVKGAGVDAWHWIEGAARDVWSFFKGTWHELVDAVEWPFKKAFGVIKDIYDVTIKPIIDAAKWFIGLFGGGDAPLHHAMAPAIARSHQAGRVIGPQGGGHPGRALGGPVFAGGLYEVGEQGRETVYIPPGGYVHPDGRGSAPWEFPREFELKVPIDNRLVIGGQEFARGMNYAAGSVKAKT